MRKPWAVVLIAVAALAALACAHPHEVGEDGSPWQPPATVDTGSAQASTPSGGATTTASVNEAQATAKACEDANKAREPIQVLIDQQDFIGILSKLPGLKATLVEIRNRPGVSVEVKSVLDRGIALIDEVEKDPSKAQDHLDEINQFLADLTGACG